MRNNNTDTQKSVRLDRKLLAELEQKMNSYTLKSSKLTNHNHFDKITELKDE